MGLSLNIYLIVFRQMGVYGVLYSGLISNGIIALVLGAKTFVEVGVRSSWGKLVAMLRYGAPMIPSGVGMFSLNFSNRFFLSQYASLSSVGLFALGARFGFMVHVLIIQPFLEIWDAKMFQVAKQKDSETTYARVLTYFLYVVIFAALGLSVLIKDILKIIASPNFFDAHKIVPILSLAYVFMSFYYHFYVGILIKQKTVYIGLVVGGTAVINLVMNWFFIPKLGIVGAAWALATSYIAMSTATYVFSYRLYPIKYEWNRIAKLGGAALIVYVISTTITPHSITMSLLLRFLLILTFPLILWPLGFYTIAETEKLRRIPGFLSGKSKILFSANVANIRDKH